MKRAKVLSLSITDAPRLCVTAYGTVQSRSRGSRVNHTVVKVGRKFRCSCEDNIFRQATCGHIKEFRLKLAKRLAA